MFFSLRGWCRQRCASSSLVLGTKEDNSLKTKVSNNLTFVFFLLSLVFSAIFYLINTGNFTLSFNRNG